MPDQRWLTRTRSGASVRRPGAAERPAPWPWLAATPGVRGAGVVTGSDMDITYVIVGLIAVAVLGGGGFFFYLKTRPPKEEPVFYYRCEACKRKLRYTAKQATQRGRCPMCKRAFVFPPTPAPKVKK